MWVSLNYIYCRSVLHCHGVVQLTMDVGLHESLQYSSFLLVIVLMLFITLCAVLCVLFHCQSFLPFTTSLPSPFHMFSLPCHFPLPPLPCTFGDYANHPFNIACTWCFRWLELDPSSCLLLGILCVVVVLFFLGEWFKLASFQMDSAWNSLSCHLFLLIQLYENAL